MCHFVAAADHFPGIGWWITLFQHINTGLVSQWGQLQEKSRHSPSGFMDSVFVKNSTCLKQVNEDHCFVKTCDDWKEKKQNNKSVKNIFFWWCLCSVVQLIEQFIFNWCQTGHWNWFDAAIIHLTEIYIKSCLICSKSNVISAGLGTGLFETMGAAFLLKGVEPQSFDYCATVSDTQMKKKHYRLYETTVQILCDVTHRFLKSGFEAAILAGADSAQPRWTQKWAK